MSVLALRNPAVLLGWVTGPILGKELRVLSRRPALYVIRAAYLAILAVPAAMAWFIWVRPVASTVKTSEMGEVAAWVVSRILTCQFIAAQAMALVLVAGALHEETRRGTLAVLFASSIRSSQIVLGKILGRLLPMVMAVALTLPLLALMRFWGGVPGGYVLAASCVTLTSALAVASLTLLLSLSGAAPHRIVVAGMTFLAAYHLGTSILSQVQAVPVWAIAGLLNPFTVIVALQRAASGGGPLPLPWTLHCGLMLGLAAAMLGASMGLLRRAAGMEFADRRGVLRGMARAFWPGLAERLAGRVDLRPCCEVKGSPVLWKESLGVARSRAVLHAGLALLAAVAFYMAINHLPVPWVTGQIFTSLVIGWWAVLSIYTASLAAASISQEREARSWAVLLATPLARRQIMRDKALAIVLRTLAGWLVYLTCTVTLQTASNGMLPARYFVPLLAMTVLNAPVYAMFLIGTGLYIGLRSRTAFSAVLLTLAVISGFHFVRQEALIPLVQMMSRLRVGPWLGYQAINLALEAVVGTAMWLLAAWSLRRRIFGGDPT